MIYAILYNPKAQQVVEIRRRWADISLHFTMRTVEYVTLANFGLDPEWWMDSDGPELKQVAKNYVQFHTPAGLLDQNLRGQGYGTSLYFGGALVASAIGYAGICSVHHERTIYASNVWTRLLDKKLATTAHQMDFLPARSVLKSGLVVGFVGFKQKSMQTPLDLILRAKVWSQRGAERLARIIFAAYGADALRPFLQRPDVAKLLKTITPSGNGSKGVGGTPDSPGLPPLSARSLEIIREYGDMP